MSGIKDYIKVQILPMKGKNKISSWEDKISDKFGPLYGYFEDLKKSNLKKILTDLIGNTVFQNENGDEFTNFFSVCDVYYNNLSLDLVITNKGNYALTKEDSQKEEDSKLVDRFGNTVSIDSAVDIFIKYGIIDIIELAIPYNKINSDFAIIMGEDIYIPQQNTYLYAKSINEIELNENYLPIQSKTIHSDLVLNYQVYIFSKNKGKLFDITKFLYYVNTSVTESGGNFQLKMGLFSLNDLENQNSYINENINETGYTKALYIQNLFKENDLIFIKFEKLICEQREEKDNLNIKGKIWDMIGLIDTVFINSKVDNTEIDIVGRDLIKLFIDDNNFFIPYQFANSQKTAFGGGSSAIFKRLFSTGKYQLEFIYSLRSIENTLGFIFSQLTNIEVLTDSCYQWIKNEYGSDWGKKFEYDESGKKLKKEPIQGIWGLINFSVDEKISHYRICDASIASPDGSIFNQIEKVCMKPFVEVIVDTFKDKYEVIARRPPWDEEDILNANIIPIDPGLVYSDNLSFDTDIYTIFQYSPQGALLGGNNSLPLSYIPMIILDEYVKIWGNKLFSATSSYIDFNTYSKTLNNNEKSPKYTFIEDLIWLIKTTAYKPFTRKGTINLRGDRRIKRGNWIWYKKTNELFYVEAVGNMASINDNSVERTTTLSVSRGMIKDFIKSNKEENISMTTENAGFFSTIKEKDGNNWNVKNNKKFSKSYFNLVDIDYLRKNLVNNLIEVDKAYTLQRWIDKGDGSQMQTDSIVVKGVFDFFMKGGQFVKSNDFNKIETSKPSKIKKSKEVLEESHAKAYLKRNRDRL